MTRAIDAMKMKKDLKKEDIFILVQVIY